jgi:hypothetical protein
MTGSLTFAYEFSGDPNDDFGWLAVTAEADGFRGANGFWVQWQKVGEFAERLSQFPFPSDTPIEAEWGYSENGAYTRVTFISLRPSNARGKVAVMVDLTDYYDVRRRSQLVLETTYANIASFREELEQLMGRTSEKAVLLSA